MRRLLWVALAAATLALSTLASGASAGLGLLGPSCGSTAPVFSPWGDLSGYYAPANGGFESGSTGWTLSGGARVVSANEPWYLSGRGSHSALLPAGGTASISVCYGVTYPAVRFVAAGVGGPATVHVRVVAHSLLGVLAVLDGGTFAVSPGWAPSPKLSTLMSALAAPLGTKSMQLDLTVTSGTAQIDDLFVDPFLVKG